MVSNDITTILPEIPQFDFVIEQLMEQWKQHTAKNEVLHASLSCGVDSSYAHSSLLRVKSRAIVKDNVYALERGG